MAKRLSEKQKDEIIKQFFAGITIEEISVNFNCTKLTITRNLKKSLGEKEFKKLIKDFKLSNQNDLHKVKNDSYGSSNFSDKINRKIDFNYENDIKNHEEEFISITPFMEIAPLNYEIENSPQKDLSSISITDIKLPKIVYMIVDKKMELQTKYLNEYPTWQFLSRDELKRKTIEIFDDLKNAKRSSNQEQKVIRVPNAEVFKIVAPLLVVRGISRIINEDKLIAL